MLCEASVHLSSVASSKITRTIVRKLYRIKSSNKTSVDFQNTISSVMLNFYNFSISVQLLCKVLL